MNELSDEKDMLEQKVAVQMVAFSVIIIMVILTLVSFIRIYSSKKEQILKDISTQATLLEAVITDHLNYSRYFINIIGRNIQRNPKNLDYIYNILKEHFTSQDFNILFGWRKYSWIDNNFLDVHDAELFIESLEGKGTTVKIVFPAYKLIYNKN